MTTAPAEPERDAACRRRAVKDLATVLVTSLTLVLVLLVPAAAHADQSDEADRLIDRTNTLLGQSYGKVSEISDLLARVDQIHPASQNAADALPLLREAKTLLDEAIATHTSALSRVEEIAALDVGPELKAYALKEKEVADLELELYRLIGELIATHESAYGQWKELTESERLTLAGNAGILVDRWGELATEIEEKQADAEQYYSDNLGDAAEGSVDWIKYLAAGLVLGAFATQAIRRRNRRRRGVVKCPTCTLEVEAKDGVCPNCGGDLPRAGSRASQGHVERHDGPSAGSGSGSVPHSATN